MNHIGKSTHRFSQHPLEQKFAETWQTEQDFGNVLAYLLGDDNQKGHPSDRDILVAATVIQWLGSPVGQSFLSTVINKQ